MALVRPRLTDHFDLPIAQAECDFAIPLLDEDLPLYVDPFLLWKSPSLQDSALHGSIVATFDALVRQFKSGDGNAAADMIVTLSECAEAGLGSSRSRRGRRLSREKAEELLHVLAGLPRVEHTSVRHIEVAQLLVEGIGKDRISDLACSILKSFLIDYTIEQSRKHGIPRTAVTLFDILDHRTLSFHQETLDLPVSPETKAAVLLIPKRWLRYTPWISLDSYFKGAFVEGQQPPKDRASVLLFNRENYGVVESFISQREAAATQCTNDPIFEPISVLSAKRRLQELKALPTGKNDKADRKFEEIAASLPASTLHPQLDYAGDQVRTESGSLIRDLVFYNTRTWDFLQDIHSVYGSRQLVFEVKNVATLQREHVNQINRYLSDEFGRFGVLVTRRPAPKPLHRNLIDLWSGQRRCIIVLTDEDLELMVTLFESKQRIPIEVLKRSYLTFVRELPS
jgi:hypothetical protein